MVTQRTIAQLAARRDELTAELSELRAEIAARGGETDPPVKAPVKAPPTAAKSSGPRKS